MASVRLCGTTYACIFCWHGRRQWFTIGKVTEQGARTEASQIEYVLMRPKQRLFDLPPGTELVEFVQDDGKPPARHPDLIEASKGLTLRDFRDRYLSTLRESLEARTVNGIGLHFKQLGSALNDEFPIRELKLSDPEGYVDKRAKPKRAGGKRLSPATIRKQVDCATKGSLR